MCSSDLDVASGLVGLRSLEAVWREVVPDALAEAAATAVVADLRSSSYRALGLPAGRLDRTVAVNVEGRAGRVGNVIVKRVRGQVARHLLVTGANPGTPAEFAAAVGEVWPVRLAAPPRPDRPWMLTVIAGG